MSVHHYEPELCGYWIGSRHIVHGSPDVFCSCGLSIMTVSITVTHMTPSAVMTSGTSEHLNVVLYVVLHLSQVSIQSSGYNRLLSQSGERRLFLTDWLFLE